MNNNAPILSIIACSLILILLIGCLSCTPDLLPPEAPTFTICEASTKAKGDRVRISASFEGFMPGQNSGYFYLGKDPHCNKMGTGKLANSGEQRKLNSVYGGTDVIFEGTINVADEWRVDLDNVIVIGIDTRGAWFKEQVLQDCPPGPYDEVAIETVRQHVANEPMTLPYVKIYPMILQYMKTNPMKTRPNPKGEGILVNTWYDHGGEGTLNWERIRYVWLVLGKKVYRISQRGDSNIPTDIRERAGLLYSPPSGVPAPTMMKQLGFVDSESTRNNSYSSGNPFPVCK